MATVRPQSLEFMIFTVIAYGAVFLLGLVGNSFVILALIRNPSMRTVTNYFIASLAVADLLICIFVVPLTLTNNIIIEWLFGEFVCKWQVWLSGTTVCASVYILVAVSSDRYLAICHPLKYSLWNSRQGLFLIMGTVWMISAVVFTPWYVYYKVQHYTYEYNTTSVWDNTTFTTVIYPICEPKFPARWVEIAVFFVLNICLAFFIPLCFIVVLYVLIFSAIMNRKTIAVDNQSSAREHRLRVRVTHMMLAVIVTFVICWIPLYSLFTYMLYYGKDNLPARAIPVIGVLRPIFQWLSLANSCLNPILYASFSAKYRLAFLEIIVLPCQRRYGNFRRFAQSTLRRVSDKRRFSIVRNTSSILHRDDQGGSIKSIISTKSIRSLRSRPASFRKENGSSSMKLRQNQNNSGMTVLTPLTRPSSREPSTREEEQPVHQTPPDLSQFHTLINDRYLDDGTMLSIPLFEQISMV